MGIDKYFRKLRRAASHSYSLRVLLGILTIALALFIPLRHTGTIIEPKPTENEDTSSALIERARVALSVRTQNPNVTRQAQTQLPVAQNTQDPTKATEPKIVPMAQNVPIAHNDNPYGIAGGGNWTSQNATELKSRMDGLVDLGVTWLRLDLSWSVVQPVNNQSYNWKPYDNIVSMANERNIKILFILNYTPGWARSSDCTSPGQCHPADVNAFANFSSEATKRYSNQGIHSWEVWNEPNKQAFWGSAANPSAYKELLAATYAAIKLHDANATVLIGGLGSTSSGKSDIDPLVFTKQLYAAGAGKFFDGLSDHPYSYPVIASYNAPWNAWQQLGNTASSLRSIMIDNGDSMKKIWITEYGAPTGGAGPIASINNYLTKLHPNHVTEELQNASVTDVLAQYNSLPYLGPFFWYSYKDNGTDSASNENFFGLVRTDNSRKPAYETYKSLIAATTIASAVPNTQVATLVPNANTLKSLTDPSFYIELPDNTYVRAPVVNNVQQVSILDALSNKRTVVAATLYLCITLPLIAINVRNNKKELVSKD